MAASISLQSAAQPPRSPRKRRLRFFVWIVFLCICGIAALGLIEAALWVFHPLPFADFLQYQVDGHIGVRPIPGQEIDNGVGYKVRINKDGFRGPDYAFDKPKGTLRILVFGGSAAFDFKASAEEKSWPGAIQVKLHEKLAIPVEVINLAVPGFDSFNSKINYLYVGRDFHPDAVILYETWNDMGQYRSLETRPHRSGSWQQNKPLWERIARKTQIGRHAHPIVRALQGRRADDITNVGAETAGDMNRPAGAKAIAWDRQNFADFARFAASDGVLPILVSMAFLGSTESLKDPAVRQTIAAGCVQRGFTPERALETLLAMSGIIQQVSRENGAVFVDGYNAVPHDLQHIRDNVHLFDAGSEKLAQAIAETLLKDPRFLKVVEKVRAEAK